MVENLRIRFLVIAVLLLGSLLCLGLPLASSPPKSPFNLGLDLRGGVELRFQLTDLANKDANAAKEAIDTTIRIFRNRLDSTGVKEISTRSIGTDQIEVSIPGITTAEAESFKQILSSIGSLEFRIEAQSIPGIDVGQQSELLAQHLEKLRADGVEVSRKQDLSELTRDLASGSATYRWVPISEKYEADYRKYHQYGPDVPGPFWMLLRYSDVEGEFVTGESIADVSATSDPETGFPAVAFSVKPGRPASNFGKLTGDNEGKPMAIVLDGEVQSAPTINSRITTSGIINGGSNGFTQEELRQLISVIRSGSLPQKPALFSENEIGPSLGEVAISRGMLAGALSLGMVLLFMIVFYAKAGLVACMALTVNMLLLLGALSFLNATLTLPGIAGLVLTIGMAVDANILIFERIREEMQKDKTIAQAVKAGFEKAFFTIVDSNLTTFLTAFFLYKFGTPTIRGFAVTLMIGIATSMFSALYFSKAFFAWWLDRKLQRLEMRSFLTDKQIDFLKYRRVAGMGSLAVIVIGLVLFFLQSDKKYGMDFTGGYEAQIRFVSDHPESQVSALIKGRFPSADVVRVGGSREAASQFQVKVKKLDEAVSQDSGSDEAENDASASVQFGKQVLALFEKQGGWDFVPAPITALTLASPDPQGRRSVTAGLHYETAVQRSALETALKRELSAVEVEGGESDTAFQVRGVFALAPNSEDQASARILGAAARVLKPDESGEARLSNPLPSQTYIGPRAGTELRDSAIRAIFFSLIGIILYIRIRFRQYRYGIAACVALVHDVLITLGVVALAHWIGFVDLEIDLAVVAAFLTIIGYSLNDTIVIFDRVRENLPRMDQPLGEIFNRSINQTLSRTILTSLTTLFVVVILFAFNIGQRNVLEGFSFALIVGIVTGTYSTVFIASPAVLWVARRTEAKRALAAAASSRA